MSQKRSLPKITNKRALEFLKSEIPTNNVLFDFFLNIKMFHNDKFGNMYKCDFNFENCNTLILSGGALKCVYFLGCLTHLDISKIQHFGGTSCGAILSTLLVVGYTPFDIFKKLMYHFNKFSEESIYALNNTSPFTVLKQILTYDYHTMKLLDFTISIVTEMIEEKGFDKNITFGQLYQKTGKDLAFVTGNASKFTEEVFSIHSHSDTPIIIAMKLSCALPIIFPICRYNNNIYVDGFFFDNFPIKLSKMFKETTGVVAITTLNSHYDKRVTKYYKNPDKYKIIMIPDDINKYFLVSKDDKFCMFMTGYNYIRENKKHCKLKSRRNTV